MKYFLIRFFLLSVLLMGSSHAQQRILNGLEIGTTNDDIVSTLAVGNLAALSTVPSNINVQLVSVLNYSATWPTIDGGGGQWQYVSTDTTSSDNGCTIHVDSLNRRWYRITNGAMLNVKWCGAVGNDVADDTVAMQHAHNLGGIVYYPATSAGYKFSAITIPSGGILGDGSCQQPLTACSSLISTAASGNSVTFTGNNVSAGGPRFENFALLGLSNTFGSAPLSNGLVFAPSDTSNAISNIQVHNVTFRYFQTEFVCAYCTQANITFSYFEFFSVAGLTISNPHQVDQGANFVAHNQFINAGAPYGTSATVCAIQQTSAGGFDALDNWGIGGNALGCFYNFTTVASGTTSDIDLVINHIENYLGDAVTFINSFGSTSVNISNINIHINEGAFNSQRFLYFEPISGGLFWPGVSATGNIVELIGPAAGQSAVPAMDFNSTNDLNVQTNNISGYVFNAGIGTGINIASTNLLYGTVANNHILAVAVPITNSAPNTSMMLVKDQFFYTHTTIPTAGTWCLGESVYVSDLPATVSVGAAYIGSTYSTTRGKVTCTDGGSWVQGG
jgi:hypothetical protein